MRISRTISAIILMVGVLALTVPLPSSAIAPQAARPATAVIVAADSSLQEISSALLRRIFQGEPSSHDGERLVPLNYPPSDPLRIAFDRAALGLEPGATGRYWVDRRIRGQGLPPRTISSPALVREVVARLRGAIGYIPADQLRSNVRAVRIDGRSHEEAGYLLAD